MRLGQLIEGIPIRELEGDREIEVKGLSYDSRRIQPGYLFVAIKGHTQDGHEFIHDATRNGAVALMAEELEGVPGNATKITVSDSREALSMLAARFYNNPCEEMDIVGITGTNGKTTTTYLLESIVSAAGGSPGVIGTINRRFSGVTHASPVTTPESLDLMQIMREMSDTGVTHVVMEVSSHALDQKRTGGCPFKTALFTNLSRDHLDYHETMEKYFRAKSLLFRNLRQGNNAVINIDDPRGEELIALTRADVLTYGMAREADVRADSVSTDRKGLRARIITPTGEREIRSSLIGRLNIYNILSAAAAAMTLDINLDAVVEGIERLKTVPGRLELVENNRGLAVVVDYAHTPDALLKAQETLRPLTGGRLITVFGCGGDRDKGKRYEMGLAAGENSDIVFITSDNPRSEDPGAIVDQIEEGTRQSGLSRAEWPARDTGPAYFIEVDRREAIRKAMTIADVNDLVLIAGKGHEDYQIVGSEKRCFDDRREVALAAS